MTANLRLMKKLGAHETPRTLAAHRGPQPTSTTTSSSSGPASVARSAPCGWSRRATGSRVIEAGARFEDEDFAKTSFDLKKFLFRPEIGCYGIQRIDAVRDSLILAGAGVGGGSLVYANTLYEPLEAFYKDAQWRDITDWKAELAPYYDQAKRMLGVVENPLRTPSDDVMEKVANDLGVGDTFHPTPVGVFFGGPDVRQGRARGRPVLRRRRPRPAHLHRVRRLHDRVQVQRQEHAGEELPLPRRAARREGDAADHGHPRRARATAAGTTSPSSSPRPSAPLAGSTQDDHAPSRSSSPPPPSAPRSCCTG